MVKVPKAMPDNLRAYLIGMQSHADLQRRLTLDDMKTLLNWLHIAAEQKEGLGCLRMLRSRLEMMHLSTQLAKSVGEFTATYVKGPGNPKHLSIEDLHNLAGSIFAVRSLNGCLYYHLPVDPGTCDLLFKDELEELKVAMRRKKFEEGSRRYMGKIGEELDNQKPMGHIKAHLNALPLDTDDRGVVGRIDALKDMTGKFIMMQMVCEEGHTWQPELVAAQIAMLLLGMKNKLLAYDAEKGTEPSCLKDVPKDVLQDLRCEAQTFREYVHLVRGMNLLEGRNKDYPMCKRYTMMEVMPDKYLALKDNDLL